MWIYVVVHDLFGILLFFFCSVYVVSVAFGSLVQEAAILLRGGALIIHNALSRVHLTEHNPLPFHLFIHSFFSVWGNKTGSEPCVPVPDWLMC